MEEKVEVNVEASPKLEIRGIIKPKKRWPAVLGSVIVLGALGLTGGAWTYANHYTHLALPHTVIGSFDVGGMAPGALKTALQERCRTLKVTLSGEAKATLSLEQLGLSCDVDATVAEVMSANSSLGRVLASTVIERNVAAKFTFNADTALDTARAITAGMPGAVTDPSLTFDESSDSFLVSPGESGKGIALKDLEAAATRAWTTQTDTKLNVKLQEVAPRKADAKLSEWVHLANQLISPRVYLVGRGIGHVIHPVEKAKWVEVTEQGPQINQAQVEQWLSTFTDEFVNLNAEPGERFLTKDHKLLTVTKMAWASKKTTNNPEIAQEISSALNAGESYRGVFEMEIQEGTYDDKTLDVSLPQPPYTPGPEETWVSVDLSNHTVTAWKGNQILWGPVACVHGSLPSPTHAGIFHIQSKLVTSHMKGEGWDGDYDVWSPWTMYYSGSYAIHGAPKRFNWVQTDYGGSHGCVNLRPSEAKELFSLVKVGTTVVIHRSGTIG